ncbi:hypothetical protein HPB49_013772 [Dermacentor silvarum]|uniref:Uncharacterized protein n=1 Tax=Dermacentor silvarum TaxID=543639 RepID=A0ACB8CFD1_DERSI|nr:hypothetical protein HPB49_013772 [Dermacentor silvarum]
MDSDSGVGTGELSELEMQHNLKMTQERRQQLDLLLKLANLKEVKAFKEDQRIYEEPSKLQGRPQAFKGENLPGFRITLDQDDMDIKPPFRSVSIGTSCVARSIQRTGVDHGIQQQEADKGRLSDSDGGPPFYGWLYVISQWSTYAAIPTSTDASGATITSAMSPPARRGSWRKMTESIYNTRGMTAEAYRGKANPELDRDFSTEEDSNESTYKPEYTGEDCEPMDQDSTESEVRAALYDLNSKSAAGPDGISNRLLKNLDDDSIKYLA